ncbi:DinB family protein [bacterium]|nr:DinB family protein [bacterium]MDC1221899.1 DinB family protein [Salibacteraceae bacterium]
MKASNSKLIDDLIDRTKSNMNRVEALSQLTESQLNWKPSPERWSVLECIEHLNRYAEFYNPEITARLAKAKPSKTGRFKSSLLGEYFSQSMLPKEKLNKMKTFAVMNPDQAKLDPSVIGQFQQYQKELLDLLSKSREVDLQKTKTSISISKIIKLRLGDTFRVLIYHNQRHLTQAEKVEELMR